MPLLTTQAIASARVFGFTSSGPFLFTISTNQTNANLRTLAVNAGWNQSSKVLATINAGVVLSSNATGTPALTVNGSFPGGVTLTSSGTIMGMGGAGGVGATYAGVGSNGSPGGLALSVSVAVTIDNTSGTIAGGGGGGGGGGSTFNETCAGQNTWGGGGGGGGRSSNTNSSGGAGGGGNTNGGNGVAGTFAAAGAGGSGNRVGGWGNGGAGGDRATAGTAGTIGDPSTSGRTSGGSGGSGGGAITGNANITWIAFGTRTGAIT